jgi:hypothetical protein
MTQFSLPLSSVHVIGPELRPARKQQSGSLWVTGVVFALTGANLVLVLALIQVL